RQALVEVVAESLALGAEVRLVVRIRGDAVTDEADDLDAVLFEPGLLRRIVRQELDALRAEVAEDPGCDVIAAIVDRQPQSLVGLDRVVAVVLQVIRGKLLTET